MRVGLTYDLRSDYLAAGYGEEETAEFDAAETIEALEGALRRLGFKTDCIGHIQHLTQRLAAGDRWDFVFNIAEGLHGTARESQVPALLDAYGIPYTFSDPLVTAVTLHKPSAKRVVRDAGIPTAPWCEVHSVDDARSVDLPFPLFVKPSSEGTGKGVTAESIVHNHAALVTICENVIRTYRQSALVETLLPGREFTVGMLGTGEQAAAIGALEIILLPGADADVYSYDNKELCDDRVVCQLDTSPEAQEACAVALAAWRVLGCRDGGRVDVRFDAAGKAAFMEVNPLPGLRPGHSDLVLLTDQLGWSYDRLIGAIVGNCLSRNGLPLPRADEVSSWAA